MHRTASTHVWEFTLSFVEVHEFHTGPPLKPVMAPLDDTPSLQYVNLTTLLAVISKLAEGALDQLPMSPTKM